MRRQRDYFNLVNNRYQVKKLQKPSRRVEAELNLLVKKAKLKPGMKVIDFGAGSGRLTFYLLQRGINVLAVDISDKSLQDLGRNYLKFKQIFWGKLELAEKLPIKKNFDAILGADVLHHITIKKLLPEMVQVVKPGGYLAFSEPNAWFGWWYVYLWLKEIPWEVEKGITQCTVKNLNDLFVNCHLSKIEVTGYGLFAYRLIISATKPK